MENNLFDHFGRLVISLGRPMERKTHCEDIHICLIGANRFQNDLFVSLMKNILHCQCRYTEIVSCVELSQVKWNLMVHNNLIFLDCFSLKGGEVEEFLRLVNENIPSGASLALYNCPGNAVYEKTSLAFGVRGFFHPEDPPRYSVGEQEPF